MYNDISTYQMTSQQTTDEYISVNPPPLSIRHFYHRYTILFHLPVKSRLILSIYIYKQEPAQVIYG